ncbi:hypothetical protein LINGRAHAP2_LOCUS26101 [Linum grandiflorum]
MSPRATSQSIPSSNSSSAEPRRSSGSTTTWASPSLARRSFSAPSLPCSDEKTRNPMNPPGHSTQVERVERRWSKDKHIFFFQHLLTTHAIHPVCGIRTWEPTNLFFFKV